MSHQSKMPPIPLAANASLPTRTQQGRFIQRMRGLPVSDALPEQCLEGAAAKDARRNKPCMDCTSTRTCAMDVTNMTNRGPALHNGAAA